VKFVSQGFDAMKIFPAAFLILLKPPKPF